MNSEVEHQFPWWQKCRNKVVFGLFYSYSRCSLPLEQRTGQKTMNNVQFSKERYVRGSNTVGRAFVVPKDVTAQGKSKHRLCIETVNMVN